MLSDIIFMEIMKKWLILFLVFFLLGSLDSQEISAADLQLQNQLYVANTEFLCDGYDNCFFNDTADLPESIALIKAIDYARDHSLPDAIINVLSPYQINSHTVLVDYPVTIVGKNNGWISTSSGDCSRPMFIISAQSTPTNTATITRTLTRTATPTRTPIYRSPTPFRTATSAFGTGVPEEPTLSLPTASNTPTIELTPDLSLTPDETPTQTSTASRTPTPTVSGTPNSGVLGKTDRYSGQKQVPFFLGGIAVLVLIALLGFYIHRKH